MARASGWVCVTRRRGWRGFLALGEQMGWRLAAIGFKFAPLVDPAMLTLASKGRAGLQTKSGLRKTGLVAHMLRVFVAQF